MESIKDRSTLNWTTDDRRRTTRRGGVILALFLAMGLISVSASAQLLGTELADKSTIARGAVFIGDNNGGHWWVSDQNLGICELVPQGLPNQAPFLLNFCNATAASGGQMVLGNPAPTLALPATAKFLYVAEDITAGQTVVRLVFSPSANGGNGGFTGSTRLLIPEVNPGKGGIKGGRPVGLALLPHNGAAANGGTQDLYVGYTKSGDITRVDGIDAVGLIVTTPTVTLIGATGDGGGVNSLVAFGPDLYLGEAGGTGFSKIPDPSGIARPACNSVSLCTAAYVTPEPSVFPGGLATDWVAGTPTTGKGIYIGDSPRGGAQHSILRYDPATGGTTTYSLNINPTYNEPSDIGVSTIWTTYINPLGLGFNAATGDLVVGDDPQGSAGAPTFQQGHIWKVPTAGTNPPSVTSIAPASGSTLGGDAVTVTGFNLAVYNAITGAVLVNPTISFGTNAGFGVSCLPTTAPPVAPVASTCTVSTPAGFGIVDVRVATGGQSSPIVPADLFTYTAPPSGAITVATVAPNSGTTVGGTLVTVTGQNLATYDAAGNVLTVASFNFGAGISPSATCLPAPVPVPSPVNSVCSVRSPAGAVGTVNVQASLTDALGVVQTSGVVPGDTFTYVQAIASLYAWGFQAPKGGGTFIPGALGGHWWTGDEGNGFCRQDPMTTAVAPFAIAGNTLHSRNLAVCGDDATGGTGQVAYDPRLIAGTTSLHYLYVASNAVFSVSIFRLTFDANTETLVADPFGGQLATEMAPLSTLRTLKPNGIALGPDFNLYIGDLVEPSITKLSTEQDPRVQSVSVVAVTGDGRGANGTAGFIGNYFYVPGNRAGQFFDITQCPLPGGGPCGMASVPAPNLVFISGLATDPVHKRVYLANSPGGAPASILNYDASTDVYVPFAPGTYAPDANGVVTCTLCTMGPVAIPYITGGLLPAPGTPNGTVATATTQIRPWDQFNHSTIGIPAGAPVPATFAFVFGLAVNPATGELAITEDPSGGGRAGRGTMWTVPYVN